MVTNPNNRQAAGAKRFPQASEAPSIDEYASACISLECYLELLQRNLHGDDRKASLHIYRQFFYDTRNRISELSKHFPGRYEHTGTLDKFGKIERKLNTILNGYDPHAAFEAEMAKHATSS